MKHFARKAAVSVFATAALAGVALTPPASAAPVITGGLVNVTVVDLLDIEETQILNGVTVQVAAAVCGVTVQALVVALGPDGVASDCDANNDTVTTVTQRTGGRR
jgi:hypothetical protein